MAGANEGYFLNISPDELKELKDTGHVDTYASSLHLSDDPEAPLALVYRDELDLAVAEVYVPETLDLSKEVREPRILARIPREKIQSGEEDETVVKDWLGEAAEVIVRVVTTRA
jgi:hypothetical protein